MQNYLFFNDTATTEIYTLSLHDALPIWTHTVLSGLCLVTPGWKLFEHEATEVTFRELTPRDLARYLDRKSTRLNSSHANISYAVFCLKKKNILALLQSILLLYSLILLLV